jgi:hypothetical protein
MLKIGILTCQRLPQLSQEDQPLIPLFIQRGYQAEPVIWNAPDIVWEQYDLLLIRNIWDYYLEPEAFNAWLDMIGKKKIRMMNPLPVVQQNKHKFYLRSFRENGVDIIPTLFSSQESPVSYEQLSETNWKKIVIKPAISAGSHLTEVYETSDLSEESFKKIVSGHDRLIQPFIEEVIESGEISMIYFNGKFSHAVLKKPKAGDFRVQSKFGGLYELFHPDQELIERGLSVISQIREPLLYGRVDGVLLGGKFHLMELELIEPDLYFQFDEKITARFVDEVLRSW